MSERVDAVIVGAGVVGLAIARELAQSGCEAVVLDKASCIGAETSSRNSGVIHAGIYYPPGCLKSRFCVEGNRLLYAFCEKHAVPHRRIGKLIVAASQDQIDILEHLRHQGIAAGVEDLRLLDKGEVADLEPNVSAQAALFSPSTGIVDVPALMESLLMDFQSAGGILALNTPVDEITTTGEELVVQTAGSDPMALRSSIVVNSAGLGAVELMRRTSALARSHVPDLYYAKGNYFSYRGKSPFKHLIYPVPEAAGLGIHATMDLAGCTRFGPDVQWVDDISYHVSTDRLETFYRGIARYFPAVESPRLHPDYAGVRPKLSGPGGLPQDFWLEGPDDHGVRGLINLAGIESPGMTSALAIAKEVARRVGCA